jgi:hypothetical protein
MWKFGVIAAENVVVEALRKGKVAHALDRAESMILHL